MKTPNPFLIYIGSLIFLVSGIEMMNQLQSLELKNQVEQILAKTITKRILSPSNIMKSYSTILKEICIPTFNIQIPLDPCMSKIESVLDGFCNPEAFTNWFLYSGKGLNEFGNYPQCSKSPDNKFMMLEIVSDEGYTKMGIGLCGPVECIKSNYQDLKVVIENTLGPMIQPLLHTYDVYLDPDNIRFVDVEARNGALMEYKSGTVVVIFFFMCLVVIVILATILNTNSSTGEKRMIIKVLECFNLRTNSYSILYSKNKTDPNLDILNGIKVLSLLWIIMGHALKLVELVPTINSTKLYDLLQNSIGMSGFYAGSVAVDLFFALSAFLAAFSFTNELCKPQYSTYAKVKLILFGYVHRYIRLFPIYFIAIIFAIYILPITYDGVLTPILSSYIYPCKQSWWKNFMYINNIWDKDICMIWTWYLSNDMQFFLITPWIVWIYLKSKRLAMKLVFGIIVISVIIQSFIISLYNINIFVVETTFIYYYNRPWCRINTYLIGILLFWLYLSYKKREFRFGPLQIINKQFEVPYMRYIYLISGFCLCLLILYITSYWFINPDKITILHNVIFGILHRPLFVIGIILIIYPVLMGYYKPLLDILGNGVFNAMARITYGAYMFHLIIMSFLTAAEDQAFFFSLEFIIFLGIDIFVLAYLFSFIAAVLFETPMILVEKKFLLEKMRGKVGR